MVLRLFCSTCRWFCGGFTWFFVVLFVIDGGSRPELPKLLAVGLFRPMRWLTRPPDHLLLLLRGEPGVLPDVSLLTLSDLLDGCRSDVVLWGFVLPGERPPCGLVPVPSLPLVLSSRSFWFLLTLC